MLTCWLFGIYIAFALLYIDSCYHVHLYIFAYICMYLFCMAACCMITLFLYDACLVIIVYWLYWHVDYIDWFSYLLLHSDSFYCIIILLSLTCIFSFLYISFILASLILFVVYYFVYILLILSLPSLCVDISDIHFLCMIAWCMTALLLCNACVVCLCGTHIYPLISKSLVSVDLVFLDLIFDMRFVTLFALRSS